MIKKEIIKNNKALKRRRSKKMTYNNKMKKYNLLY